jgi:hypothetical protein
MVPVANDLPEFSFEFALAIFKTIRGRGTDDDAGREGEGCAGHRRSQISVLRRDPGAAERLTDRPGGRLLSSYFKAKVEVGLRRAPVKQPHALAGQRLCLTGIFCRNAVRNAAGGNAGATTGAISCDWSSSEFGLRASFSRANAVSLWQRAPANAKRDSPCQGPSPVACWNGAPPSLRNKANSPLSRLTFGSVAATGPAIDVERSWRLL